MIYRDDDHLSTIGSKFVSPIFDDDMISLKENKLSIFN